MLHRIFSRLVPAVRRAPALATRSFVSRAAVLKSDQVFLHIDTPENNLNTPFEFSAENYSKIETILKKYPANYKRSAVIALLHLAQEQNEGWIPISAMDKIARILDMHLMRVYEVATFYTMFNRQPIGKHHVQVCTTTPCMVRGAYDIVSAVEKHLGIKVGQSTPDKLFHLSEAECLGACVNAPMMQIAGPICNDSYYEDLTPETAIAILEKLKKGQKPTAGPQNGRKGCIGEKGKTALLGEPPAP